MSYFYTLFQNFINYVLNPGRIVDSAMTIAASIAVFIQNILYPHSGAGLFDAALGYFATGPFAKFTGLFAYAFSPVCPSPILLSCLDVEFLAWSVFLLFKIGFTIKGWFWAMGS